MTILAPIVIRPEGSLLRLGPKAVGKPSSGPAIRAQLLMPRYGALSFQRLRDPDVGEGIA